MSTCLLYFVAILFYASALEDGGRAPRLPLNDGNSIPALGLGTFLGFDEKGQKAPVEGEVENAVKWALEAGYRVLDTAAAYENEHLIGKAIAQGAVKKEDIFITTKLGSNEQRDVMSSLKNSLKRLGTDYVDLYLIHNPVAFTPDHSKFDVIDYLDTWKSMEEVKRMGLARSIGVSNFNVSQLQRLLDHSTIKPAVLQVEVNLNLAQQKLLDFCKKNNILVMAYTPFGSLFDTQGGPPPHADDPTLLSLASKYKKTTPQIVLRYLVQRGVVPIPKSIREDKIKQNIDVFDFQLSSEEMEIMGKFNKNHRTVWPSFWQDHPYYPFERKDVPDKNIFEG